MQTILRAADRAFALTHFFACLSIALLAGMIVLQVGARALDAALDALGLPITGFIVPSLAEFAGFLFVAGTFLALGSTLRHGVHIRVTLLIDHVPAGVSRALRVLGALVGVALFTVATYYAVELVVDSFRFNDLSYGIIAVPLGIPQAAMAVGLGVFTLAMLAEAVRAATGDDAREDDVPTLSAGEPAAPNTPVRS